MKILDVETKMMLDLANGQVSETFTKILLKEGFVRLIENPNIYSDYTLQSLCESFDPFFYHCEVCDETTGFKYKAYKKISDKLCVLTFVDSFEHEIKIIFSKENFYENNKTEYHLVKIAQYPTVKMKIENRNQYAKYLTKEQFSDYVNAHKAKKNNLYIASFLYLRRIFESLIFKVDDGTTSDKIKEKVKTFVEDGKLNKLFTNQGFNSIYSILSKHVHQLTEEEALANIDTMFLAINRVIDEQIAHEQKIKDDKALENNLNNINENIKSK